MDLNSGSNENGPPSKKIKSLNTFNELINECFRIKFQEGGPREEEREQLEEGLKRIRETIEQATSSSDVSFGSDKLENKRTWGKCLGLMLEDTPQSLNALKKLNRRLAIGGGLL